MTYEQLWQTHVEHSDNTPELYKPEYHFMAGVLSALTLIGDTEAAASIPDEIDAKLERDREIRRIREQRN